MHLRRRDIDRGCGRGSSLSIVALGSSVLRLHAPFHWICIATSAPSARSARCLARIFEVSTYHKRLSISRSIEIRWNKQNPKRPAKQQGQCLIKSPLIEIDICKSIGQSAKENSGLSTTPKEQIAALTSAAAINYYRWLAQDQSVSKQNMYVC